MKEKEERRQLKKVFIKDIGWKEVGYDKILEISEHPNNGWIRIVYEGKDDNWDINPFYLIMKSMS